VGRRAGRHGNEKDVDENRRFIDVSEMPLE
jgi:hypothetical protein